MRSYSYYGNVALDQTSEAKVRPRKKTVKVKRLVSVQEKLLYIVAMVLLVCLSALVLTRYAEISQVNYEIQQMEQQISQYKEENMQLRSEAQSLKSRQRIQSVAREELGMTPIEENVIFVGTPTIQKNTGD